MSLKILLDLPNGTTIEAPPACWVDSSRGLPYMIRMAVRLGMDITKDENAVLVRAESGQADDDADSKVLGILQEDALEHLNSVVTGGVFLWEKDELWLETQADFDERQFYATFDESRYR
jgi:sugar diacid utilization regulator